MASYAKVRGEPTLDDLGFPQQAEIFERYGGPVVEAADILRDPPGTVPASLLGTAERPPLWLLDRAAAAQLGA